MEHEEHTIIPTLIDYLFDTSKGANKNKSKIKDSALQWRVSIAFRRFVALTHIMRPQAFAQDVPGWKLAEVLGVDPGQFSRTCKRLSNDMGGLRNPRMKTDGCCKALSSAKMGNSPKASRRSRTASVESIPANRYRVIEQRGVRDAMKAFKDGLSWSKEQSRLLFSVGYIDEDGILTGDGVKAMGGVE